jgi:hypothetical protein
MSLVDKLRRARERDIPAAGHVFTVRRPTALQRIELLGARPVDLVRQCVSGWNLRLIDLIPGGDASAAPFDELWSEWLDDHPEVWAPLSEAVLALVQDHDAALEAAEKN